MSETKYAINTSNMDGMYGYIYEDVTEVPEEVWFGLQSSHRESIRANLSADDQQRADDLVHWGNLRQYIATRVDPMQLVGNAWRGRQLIRDPQVSVLFDVNQEVVGGAITELNTSASLMRNEHPRIDSIECKAKMMTPPWLPVPVVGGKKWVQLREAYSHPGIHAPKKLEPDQVAVSGIALISTWRLLETYNDRLGLSSYVYLSDPADREMLYLTGILGMEPTEGEKVRRQPLPNYDPNESPVRVKSRVGTASDVLLVTRELIAVSRHIRSLD